MRRRSALWAWVLGALVAGSVQAEPLLLDPGEDPAGWEVIASDGVEAKLVAAPGVDGAALRLEYNFARGSGFCVMRRKLAQELPANYRFRFHVRGEGPPNNLEFKLVDPSGENVWWVNKRAFELPAEWRQITYRARQFQFAWGPSGGKPLSALGAIEFAIAAAEGGRGALELDQLSFEELPPVLPSTRAVTVQVSSTKEGATPPTTLPDDGTIAWHGAADDPHPTLTLDFQDPRELGGIILGWDREDYPPDYSVELTADGQHWETAMVVERGNGGFDYVPLAEAEARGLRVTARSTARGEGVRLTSLRIAAPVFGESRNAFLRQVAADAPRGHYPRYTLGEQTAWTVVGVEDARKEALFSADGALEVDKLGFSIEPFLLVDDRLVTWADVTTTHALTEGYLPIPQVIWRHGDLKLTITALGDGSAAEPVTLVAYQLRNTGTAAKAGRLVLAARPLQVLPPWQELNITGGFSPIDAIDAEATGGRVNGKTRLHLLTPAAEFGATTFAGGDISEYLAAGKTPARASVRDPQRLASAGWQYPYELAAGGERTWVAAIPLSEAAYALPAGDADAIWNQRRQAVTEHWRGKLNRARLELPDCGRPVADTFRTTQAYILINRDGPSIQPGSRSYERSWIRDGALTSTGLLVTGHPEEARAFLDWYAPFQYENGKIPCVVDVRGPDPVAEHDSTGEYLYALYTLYGYNHDRAMLEAHLPRVTAAVEYIAKLRAERSTPEYASGDEEKRAYFGLVPESISHEGYSAKPMHSYWDNFFIQRGLRDAVLIAKTLDRSDLEARFTAERDGHAAALQQSLVRAMKLRGIDYLPGCVELGDFDATSTAVALFPCKLIDLLPPEAVRSTFDRYFDFFTSRRDGALTWDAYTPYEVRLMGTFVLLGERQRAHDLLAFFLGDQRPAGWNQWGEVVHRDKKHPGFIGDMPHTWVGSDFLNAVRTMFVYEHPDRASLVLAAGVTRDWTDQSPGVRIADFPTEFGPVSYTIRGTAERLEFELLGDGTPPAGGFLLDVAGLGPFSRGTLNGAPLPEPLPPQIHLAARPARVVLER